jgi:hypothetical protein
MKTKIFSIVAADALPELVWYYNSMENYWLSDVNYQKSVVKNINEMRDQRMQGTVAPAEREFAEKNIFEPKSSLNLGPLRDPASVSCCAEQQRSVQARGSGYPRRGCM